MPKNIEIKARAEDVRGLKEMIERLSDGPPETLHQEDIFFNVPSGRLKLRLFSVNRGELIFYQRANRTEPKSSNYLLTKTDDPSALLTVLEGALGVSGFVKKTRTLYYIGQTRVHLDEVEGLGRFIELEVVMRPGQSEEEGRRIAHHLMEKLGIQERHLISTAYVDMLKNRF
jgi:predicted adenylyl cyclase CyaB